MIGQKLLVRKPIAMGFFFVALIGWQYLIKKGEKLMEQQKQYQVDLYIGLLDPDDLLQHFTIKEAVDSITKIIGDCTIIPCIGSCTHFSGVRINLNTLKVTKFIDYAPEQFIDKVEAIKKVFNQYDILMNMIECEDFRII